MTAINATPRPIHPPRRTTARRTSRTRPSYRRALAIATTAALLAGTGIAIDAAISTASAADPTSPSTSQPIGTRSTDLKPPLGPAGIGPVPVTPGPSI